MCFRVDSVLFGRRCCCCCCCQMGRQLGFIRRNFLGRKERKTGDERAARKARTCVHCGIAEFLRPRVFFLGHFHLSLSLYPSQSLLHQKGACFSLIFSLFLHFSLLLSPFGRYSSFFFLPFWKENKNKTFSFIFSDAFLGCLLLLLLLLHPRNPKSWSIRREKKFRLPFFIPVRL